VVTLAGFALGACHQLSGITVFGTGVALAAGGLALARRVSGARDAGPGQPRQGQAPVGGPPPSLAGRVVRLACVVVLALWAAHLVLNGLLAFPRDWDTLMYHLPLVDHWLQARSLYAPDAFRWFNAGTNELLALWIVAPCSGDYLAALNNVPACLLLALGTLELARGLELRAPFDYLLAFAATATPVFFTQLFDNENDIAVAGLFVTCLAYGLRYVRRPRAADLGLAAVAVGLLAGVKYYAVGYAVVAWTGLTLYCWLQRGTAAAWRTAAAGVLGVVVLGGYWYGRNVWLTGAPFFPMGFTRATNQLRDYYPNTWSSTFLGSGRPEVWPLGFKAVWNVAGPCHALALLAFPVTVSWLAGSGLLLRVRPGGERAGTARWLLAFLTLGSGAVLVVTPWAIETEPGTLDQLLWGYCPVRFGQCFLTLAVLALGVVLADLTREGVRWAGPGRFAWPTRPDGLRGLLTCLSALGSALPALLLAALVAWQAGRAGEDPLHRAGRAAALDTVLLTVDAALAGLFLATVADALPPRVRRRAGFLLLPAAGAALVWGGAALAGRWHAGFARHYDRMFATSVFTDLAGREPSATRVCVLDYRGYPFFGSRRQYRLCQPEKAFSYPWLVQYLRDHDVNVVAGMLYEPRVVGRFRDVSLWIRDHPRVFVTQQEDGGYIWSTVDRAQLLELSPP
jgi:hypothetical protein